MSGFGLPSGGAGGGVDQVASSSYRWCWRRATSPVALSKGFNVLSLGTTISQSSDFDGVSHGSRLKVGPNISLVRISSNTRINANLEHSARARLWRGGAVIEDHIAQSSSPRAAAFASSGPIAVLPGDEFDFYIIPIAAVSTQIGASPSDTPWLLLEVLA